ncbi:MAG: hypothetical protein K9N21_04650 [Deltaproteobacteria bacterium]|nr:hypothetical protein [Deltaproteobacteria bacterium]
MVKRRTVAVGLALLGIMVIAGAGVAGCHRPPGYCGGGFHGKEFPKDVLERMDSEIETLELTGVQQEAYGEIRERVESELMEMGQGRKAFFQEVKTEMDKDAPDLGVVADLLKSHGRQFPDRMAFFVDQFMNFYQVLDMEQKEKVVAHLKGKFKKFEAFRALVAE